MGNHTENIELELDFRFKSNQAVDLLIKPSKIHCFASLLYCSAYYRVVFCRLCGLFAKVIVVFLVNVSVNELLRSSRAKSFIASFCGYRRGCTDNADRVDSPACEPGGYNIGL